MSHSFLFLSNKKYENKDGIDIFSTVPSVFRLVTRAFLKFALQKGPRYRLHATLAVSVKGVASQSFGVASQSFGGRVYLYNYIIFISSRLLIHRLICY
jgi:hypothetical protein